MKRIFTFLLALLMLTGSLGTFVSALYENIYTLTVVGVAEFGGGDVEAGTDLSLVLPAEPQKRGYRFTGWVVTNGAGKVIDQPTVMPAFDVTFTAQWEVAVALYNITFLTEEGEVIQSRDYPQGAAVEAPDYAPAGMRLRGWRNTQTGKIEKLPSAMPARDLEYLAVLEEIYYTVTFMDGTAEVGEVTVGLGEKAEIIDRIPQEGKVFLGWCLDPNGTEPDYLVGDLLDLQQDLTLYALWAAEAPNLTLCYPTLTFEDVITMNVFFEASNLEDVVEMGLIIYKSEVIDYGVENAEAVIPGYYEASGMYVASTEGIPAKDMGDTYWFAVYAKLSDGSCAYTRLVSYSPAQYAYGQLSDPEMTKLVVAMLNYGAAAQTYFNYRTDSLMNKDLTAAQQASIESYRADMMASVVNADSTKVGIFTNNGGFSRRYPTITFDGAFCIDYFFTPAKTPSGNVSLYYWTQDAYEAAGTLTPANASGKLTMTPDGTGTYRATIEGIAAKDLDKTVYVSADYTSGGTSYCSGVLAYSIGAYCVSQAASTDPVSPFAKATAVYGYYAKELFY